MSDVELPAPIAKRRTFAIISHPDAGKTTLTEKLLLFGGAIQAAGEVRARGQARRARNTACTGGGVRRRLPWPARDGAGACHPGLAALAFLLNGCPG